MKIGENVSVGWSQRNVPAPEKVRLFVNATIIILGTIVGPIIAITPAKILAPEVAAYLANVLLILCGGLKGLEKLMGQTPIPEENIESSNPPQNNDH